MIAKFFQIDNSKNKFCMEISRKVAGNALIKIILVKNPNIF